MELEQYFEGALFHNDIETDESSSQKKHKSEREEIRGAVDDTQSCGFDCNICLDSVHDPVVTLCGHLYCWPCIYKWLRCQNKNSDDQHQNPANQQCPVCKSEVSLATLIPLYGRGQTTKPSKHKAPHLGIVVPQRPRGPTCGAQDNSPRSPRHTVTNHHDSPYYYNYSNSLSGGRYLGGTAMNLFDPLIGIFGGMVYTRMFRNSMTNVYHYPNTYNLEEISSPTVRRYLARADESLNNLCIFLFCFLFMCLILF